VSKMRKKRAKIGLTWTVFGFFGSNCSLSSLTVGSSAGGGGGARFSFFDLFSLEDFFSLFSKDPRGREARLDLRDAMS